MTRMLRATSALSAVTMAVLIAGCANPMSRAHSAASAEQPGKLVGAATRAQLALASGDFATAISWGEQAVANTPNDALLRGLLGNAYMAAGRFASAEAVYNDALALSANQPDIAMKLALAQIAQGKGEQTVQLLDQLRSAADPADVGLAMALAGQPGNAVAILDEAARRPGADGRTRQNLALAHALAGDWEAARVIASQDLPADQVDRRLSEWMALAKPASPSVKVATLLGVTPAASDPGMPQRLALNDSGVRMAAVSAPPAPAAHAAVEAMPLAASAPAVPQMASAETTVLDNPGFAVPVSAPVEELVEAAPVEQPAQLADVTQTLDSLRTETVRPSGALPKISQLRRTAAARFAKSGVVVQLGAYGSPKRVQAAWSSIERRHSSLGRYTPVSARFQSPAGTVYRLSLKGFETDREARLLCEQLKRSGSSCFVRNVAGDTPVRLARR